MTGRDNGLSLTLDGHWHSIPVSAIEENFEGFTAIIDAGNQYPQLESNRKINLMAGHENLVSLSAFKVTTDQSVFHLSPDDRQCFFAEEKKLTIHKHYTRSNCLFECVLNASLSSTARKCLPWFYPDIDHVSTCDPWETRQFRDAMDQISIDEQCTHCLPECFETQYSASLSTAPFRMQCDLSNIGRTTFCDVDFTTDRDLYIWGKKVLNKYKTILTDWTSDGYKTALDQRDKDYDPYKRDIAQVYFFFESPTIIEYSRETRLTFLELVGQIGGLMGLCVGISLVSLIEVAYWVAYSGVRLGVVMTQKEDNVFYVRRMT
jgi:hypothetical protein